MNEHSQYIMEQMFVIVMNRGNEKMNDYKNKCKMGMDKVKMGYDLMNKDK